MSAPILTVVVPTKDRAEYARWCIPSLQSMLSNDCEIVIHDNSRDDSLGRELAQGDTLRLVKYLWCGDRLSITENCDRAVAAASGEFVTMIGDDDAIGPDLEGVARWALAEDIDAVVPANLGHYFWPDLHGGPSNMAKGHLTLKPFTGRTEERDVQKGLDGFLRSGGLNIVDSTELPKLYYGLVRRRCLHEVRGRTSTFFPGVSPDVAVAVALCSVINRLYAVDYPLYLPGSSYRSGAGSSARKEHYGRLEEQKHLSAKFIAEWPGIIPRIYTVQTLWGATVVQTIEALRRPDLLVRLNRTRMLAFCYLFNPALRPGIAEGFRSGGDATKSANLAAWAAFAGYFFMGMCLRLKTLLARTAGSKRIAGEYRMEGPSNILAATAVLRDILVGHASRLMLKRAREQA